MENVMTLKAESRNEVGKKIAKKLRREGRIPAIIYGEHKESIPISIAAADLKTILKSETGENTVLRIHRDDVQVDAMLKELQYDHLSDHIIHADLIRIDLNKRVTVNVPVRITGVPVGVKTEGGFFDFMTREIRLRCLPTQIAKEFVLDVTGLHAGQSIKAEDIEMPEGSRLLTDAHAVVCSVEAKSGGEGYEAEGEAPEEKSAEAEE
jgi:large subunit ribosomal protein L25